MSQSMLDGVDATDMSQSTLDGVDATDMSQSTLDGVDATDMSQSTLDGVDAAENWPDEIQRTLMMRDPARIIAPGAACPTVGATVVGMTTADATRGSVS